MACKFKFPKNQQTGTVFSAVYHGTKFTYVWNGMEWDFKGATEELGLHQNNNYTHQFCGDNQCECGSCDTCLCSPPGPPATLFFYNAESNDGNLALFWEEGTIPENLHLKSVATDGQHLRVWVYLDGARGSAIAPILTIDGTEVPLNRSELYQYKGFLDLTITETPRTVLATSDANGRDLLEIADAVPGPVLYDIVIGPYPGTQTELKAGDLVTITVTCANETETCKISSIGLDTLQTIPMKNINSAGEGRRYAEGQVTIGANEGSFTVTAVGANSFGTQGTPITSLEELKLSQIHPTVTLDGIIYHSGNPGLGEDDTADISVEINDFDLVEYTSEFVSIPNPTTYELTKTVTYLTGDYIDTQNYHILAVRTSNDARTSESFIITIANENPTAIINILDTNGHVLTTSETGVNYTVRLICDQDMLSVTNLDAVGLWISDFIQEGPRTFTRTLKVKDSDPRGSHYFGNLQMTNVAGVTGTEITQGAQYFLQGFQEKIIVFNAYSQIAPIGTSITDINNVNVRYNEAVSNLELRHTTDFWFDGFTIVDENGNYDPTGNHLFLTDSNIVTANTTGSLSVLLIEIVT